MAKNKTETASICSADDHGRDPVWVTLVNTGGKRFFIKEPLRPLHDIARLLKLPLRMLAVHADLRVFPSYKLSDGTHVAHASIIQGLYNKGDWK